MKLIIEVDQKYYEACKDAVEEPYPSQIEEIIANGTPYNPSGDLISRSALIREIGRTDEWYKGHSICNIIDDAPTVPLPDFKEGYKQAIIDGKTNFSRTKGEWKLDSIGIYCSECKTPAEYSSNFCPNCGADMRKGGAE